MSALAQNQVGRFRPADDKPAISSGSSTAEELAGIDTLETQSRSRLVVDANSVVGDASVIGDASVVGDDSVVGDSLKNDARFTELQCAINADQKHTPNIIAEGLPALRRELRLEPAQFTKNGQPKWTLHDPVKGKYYRLGWLEFELLSRWQSSSVEELIERTNQETTLRVDRSRVDNLINMLSGNELIIPSSAVDLQRLRSNITPAAQSMSKSAFRLSMFYRRSLVNPDAFLASVDRLIQPLYSHKLLVLIIWAFTAVMAAFGVGAHWFEFRSTFTQFMTMEGFVLFGVVLILTNCLHEIGHGLVAKHYKCRITEMGVALIFMLPVCYCDTSDTWRLSKQRQRLLVSAGGLLMEIGVATLACLLWLMLPDGIPRTLMFFIAVTSLLTTLLINLNPFMKFDGYYLLSDFLAVDNLQVKSFSNLRWQLRRWLTGSTDARPYRVPESSHQVLNCYAFSTWVYRLLLYFTICWMVYQFWFKALGLILMTGVFVTMIITPVAKEITTYIKTINRTGLNKRSFSSVCILTLLVGFLLIPLPRKVSAPALLGSEEVTRLFAPAAAQVREMHVEIGQQVKAGQKILTLTNPELNYQQDKLFEELEALKRRKRAETQWLSNDFEEVVTAHDITAAEASLTEVLQKRGLLELTASADGVITSLPDWIKPGVWVNANTVLAEFASLQEVEVRAYVPASKRDLIAGDRATFYAKVGGQPVELTVKSISDSNVDVLEDHSLAVVNGGDVAASALGNGELQPLQGRFLAVLAPIDSTLSINNESTGHVMFSASAESLVSSAFNRLYGVVIRESGF